MDHKLKRYFAKGFFSLTLSIFALGSAFGQNATVTVSLDEKFFDALLTSVFLNFDPPQFSVAENRTGVPSVSPSASIMSFAEGGSRVCSQTVKILREMNGVRTAVRFRDGKIYVPLAFSGNYAPPFIGCVEFSGWAESNVDLEFDKNSQRLLGRVRVFNVNLTGTGGVGGTLIARMLQSSIDKKMNPIEVLTLDKLSFGLPVQGAGKLRMNAAGVRPVMGDGVINMHIDYAFSKE